MMLPRIEINPASQTISVGDCSWSWEMLSGGIESGDYHVVFDGRTVQFTRMAPPWSSAKLREKYVTERFPMWLQIGQDTLLAGYDYLETRFHPNDAQRLVSDRARILAALLWALGRLSLEDQAAWLKEF